MRLYKVKVSSFHICILFTVSLNFTNSRDSVRCRHLNSSHLCFCCYVILKIYTFLLYNYVTFTKKDFDSNEKQNVATNNPWPLIVIKCFICNIKGYNFS